MFKSIEEMAVAEIIEKKSKFIATLEIADSKEEAEEILQSIRKKYHDSKHNCYAYIVNNYEKCSDDGEPSGTAGAPLLALLKSYKLSNVIIVVTRYFGGILLGTGGLVRAYTDVAKKAIENAKIVDKEYGLRYKIEISYNTLKEIQYFCQKNNIKIIKYEYGENIHIILESSKEIKEKIEEKMNIIKSEIVKENIIIKK